MEERKKDDHHLTFAEQWRVVQEGLKRGVKHDGCTGVPDFDFGADCCGEHDTYYQLGGGSRWEADKRMRKCIRRKGYVVLPWVYWLGARVLGGPIWKRYRNEESTVGDDTDRSG